MKLLSVAVPCYNSRDYMMHAIESLLTGGPDIEIIIVNDGSKDETLSIARDYEEMYPGTVIVVDQENKGHGGAVMAGLRAATGIFFRVVDSDDRVGEEALKEVLREMRTLVAAGEIPDLILTNFIYDKEGKSRKKTMRYANLFPERTMVRWADMRRFKLGQYILMHSVTYRRTLLTDCGLTLPEHTFYVDNIFVYHPMQYVRTIYYIDTDLYYYYIGREDQSVNEAVMCSRIDQQIKVTCLMIDCCNPFDVREQKQRTYLIHYQTIILTVSSILLNRIGTREALTKKDAMWRYLRRKNPRLYRHIRRSVMGRLSLLRSKVGRKLTLTGYKISRKFYGFN
ncbi:MAG: glycosyltransferase family 2 protein [Eubacteriales bacterium]|nr:glycosyltransferase family 2 protein [Eubacteriales bacterium]